MHRLTTCLTIGFALACGASTCFGTPIQWTISSGGNGHWYDVKLVGDSVTWDNARIAASDQSFEGNIGYLVTITSQAENDFIVSSFGDAIRGVWTGAFQPPGSAEPAGGWQWITGEPFVYTNWQPGEPNNSGGSENNMTLATAHFTTIGQWNDLNGVNPPAGFVDGYVVEFVPEPSGIVLIALAQVLLSPAAG